MNKPYEKSCIGCNAGFSILDENEHCPRCVNILDLEADRLFEEQRLKRMFDKPDALYDNDQWKDDDRTRF